MAMLQAKEGVGQRRRFSVIEFLARHPQISLYFCRQFLIPRYNNTTQMLSLQPKSVQSWGQEMGKDGGAGVGLPNE